MARVKKNTQDKYNTPFAGRLRELLDAPGLSQSQLAEHIGVTRQAVSSYSLGTSVPDIEKFEKIADFFHVSTEYLLGRSDIKKTDATKQAAAEYLGLTEEAIDAIYFLKMGRLEQHFSSNYKPVLIDEPLTDIFSRWVEMVDLSKLMSELYRTVQAAEKYAASGEHPKYYQLEEEATQAIAMLKAKGCEVLPLPQLVTFYSQSAVGEFTRSIEMLLDEAGQIDVEEPPEETQ